MCTEKVYIRDEDVLYVVVHMDENFPHIHAASFPISAGIDGTTFEMIEEYGVESYFCWISKRAKSWCK